LYPLHDCFPGHWVCCGVFRFFAFTVIFMVSRLTLTLTRCFIKPQEIPRDCPIRTQRYGTSHTRRVDPVFSSFSRFFHHTFHLSLSWFFNPRPPVSFFSFSHAHRGLSFVCVPQPHRHLQHPQPPVQTPAGPPRGPAAPMTRGQPPPQALPPGPGSFPHTSRLLFCQYFQPLIVRNNYLTRHTPGS